jgi:hypothetical protein
VHTWSHKHVTHVRAENDVEKSDSMRRWGGLDWGGEGERRATAVARPMVTVVATMPRVRVPRLSCVVIRSDI